MTEGELVLQLNDIGLELRGNFEQNSFSKISLFTRSTK